MATQILMPALSPTMEEGTLAKWLVKEGDAVTSGQIIAEIETDKATMEFEAVDEGKVGGSIAEGTEGVKVNTPIAVLLDEERRPRRRSPRPAGRAQGRKAAPPRPSRRPLRPPRPSPPHRKRSPRFPLEPASEPKPCARPCATRWPRRCAATATSS